MHSLPPRTPLAVALTALLVASTVAPSAEAALPPDAPAAEKEAADLDYVIVRGLRNPGYAAERSSTATRTDTPLLDVPQSVTVITDQQLRDRGVQSMTDAVRYVPGVGIVQGEGNRDGLVFRGNTSTADFFIDGMRDDVQYYRDTYNIAQIEAFRGPSAMIFGRGNPGGLLNRVTRVADGLQHRDATLQFGSWNKRRATADLSQPLGAANGVRVTGVYEDSEGFRDGFELERRGINPTLAIAAGERTRLVFGYEYFSDARTADRGVPSYAAASGDARYAVATAPETFFGDPELSRSETDVHALQAFVEHDFGDGVVLRNRTRAARYDKYYSNVFAGGSVAGDTVQLSSYDNATERDNVFTQTDLIFSADTGAVAHKFVVGAEYGRQRSDNERRSGRFDLGAGSPCLAGSTATGCRVSIFSPNVRTDVDFVNNSAGGSGDARNRVDVTLGALYLQDQIEFSPQWQAILGVRYDRFDLDFNDRREGVSAANAKLSSSDGMWSPRAGLVWQPVEQASIYVSYGVSHLPRSGEQFSSLSAATASLDPEKFENYEIGAKWRIDEDLVAEAAVYRLDRSNAAVADPNDATRLILLDGASQRVDGVELSLGGKLTDAWQVVASYGWQDARTVRAVGSVPAGRELAQTPEHSIGVWNRYDFNERWGVGLGAIYRSASWATISNAVRLRSYTRYDAAVYYTLNDRLSLQLNLENLTDKEYFPSAHNDNNITTGAPLGAWVSANFKF